MIYYLKEREVHCFVWNLKKEKSTGSRISGLGELYRCSWFKFTDDHRHGDSENSGNIRDFQLQRYKKISLKEAIELGFDPSCLTPKEIVEMRKCQ